MLGATPAIVSVVESEPDTCRCGTKLTAGSPRLRILGLPRSVEEVFEGREFCSGRCVRAYFLEAMELLDSLYSKEATGMVSDLHLVFQALAQSFAEVLRDPGLAD